jgi:hypothetical protein
MLNNGKSYLAWVLPCQIKPNFFKNKIVIILKKFGRVDKLTIIRHLILTLYGYVLSPFLFGVLDEMFAVMFLFIFQIINLSVFIKISKRSQKDGLLLWLVSLIFGKRTLIKSFFLCIFEPFLYIFIYIRSGKRYFINKKITVVLLTILCTLVASITWSIFVYYSGLSTFIWEKMLRLF